MAEKHRLLKERASVNRKLAALDNIPTATGVPVQRAAKRPRKQDSQVYPVDSGGASGVGVG